MRLCLLATSVFAGAWATAPIAPHFTVSISPGDQVAIALTGYDVDGDELTATIASVPDSGTLSQLSQVFSDYGYEPMAGDDATASAVVTGSKNRVAYTAPDGNVEPTGKFTTFTYTVNDGTSDSEEGIVTIVSSSSGDLVKTDFYSDAGDWTVVGNRASSETPTHESASRGLLNHYVYHTDNDLHIDAATGNDQARWFFQAPDSFLGNQGLAYGGSLDFLLSSFSGDFSSGNLNDNLEFIVLECSQCALNTGVRLVRFIDDGLTFSGATTSFSIGLSEDDGWLLDPENTNLDWAAPTQCEMVEVLSGLSAVRILGDHTKWYESVSMDAVALKHGDGIPICAQGSADASVCTC